MQGEAQGVRRIVFITQTVDPTDTNLGATVAMIAALARRVDEVVVLCDHGVDAALPENCRLRQFGAPARRRRAYGYVSSLIRELRPRPIAVVAHMVPLYTVVAAPFVRPLRIPLMLWYTHWKGHVVVRSATLVATHLLSLDVRSFPLRSSKVHGIGHGIDMRDFPCAPPSPTPGRSFRVMSLGRYASTKGLDELLEGVRLARERGLDATIELYGTASPGSEVAHKGELERLVTREEYRRFASVSEAIPRNELASTYAHADVVASNHCSPDKIVLEACASCRPVLASDECFDRLFEGIEPPLVFERGRPETLADRLIALAALSDEQRDAIGQTLHERVSAHHSVESWADAIVQLAQQ